MPPQRVVLAKVVTGPANNTLRAIGLVEADMAVDLKARVSGFLLERTFKEGDRVKEGQVLFRIEPEQYQAALSAAQADVASATAQMDRATLDYNRIRDLYQKKSSPKSDFDNASAALDVARATLQAASARLEQAALNLEYTTVKAPFDGEIGDTPFSEGTLLGPESGVLARVVKADPVEVTFGLSDKVMASSRLGDPRSGLPGGSVANLVPRLIINDRDYYKLDGQITYVAPEVDHQTDTIKLKSSFPNPDGALAPGQSVIVSLEPKNPLQVLLIPKNSVMTAQGESYVYVTAPGPDGGLVSQTRQVKIGIEFDEGYEVLEGLSEGDEIISLGLMSAGARLRPGAPVQVVEPEDAGLDGTRTDPPPAAEATAPGEPPADHQPPAPTGDGGEVR
jgi:membrane fusion protein (multidrug efflux system)